MGRKKKKVLPLDSFGKKKLVLCLTVSIAILILLVIRIGFLQFVQGADLKKLAVKGQMSSKTIEPSRGTIYDSTGKALAISAKVDTVSVNPTQIKFSGDTTLDNTILAHAFSDIFELDYDEILEKLNTKTSSFVLARKVESDKITLLENWKEENRLISGITVTEEINRYYPYNNLASNLIGFTGAENSGSAGLEYSLNDILTGTPGKVLALTDSVNSEIPNTQQTYVEAQDGSNVVLTIDVNIQSVAEKYLSQAVEDNNADGGNVLIMNPSNGDVLAMATYPDYNLNEPYTINTPELKEVWDTLSAEEKSNEWYNMWKNKAVQDTYEPGSTFKIITAAAGLEEGLLTTDNTSDFYCAGSEEILGIRMNCWRHSNPHGAESLRNALENSCNPAFIQLGRRLGAPTLYKYYRGFGLFDRTSKYFYGESNSVFFDKDNINEFNLATMSFGQRFTITPIQLITAISAVANEGVLMEPRIVKEIKNPNTGATTVVEPKSVRQVISKETADSLMDMLQSVVTDGTGKYAQVPGYSVAGKTGTSEPLYGTDNGYVASMIAMSPTVNTQVVVLVIIYNPKGASHEGSVVAGPVAKQILSEVLPYVGVASNNTEVSNTSTNIKTITLPDVRNKSIEEAKSTLKNAGFNVKITGNEDEATTLIVDQVPKPGVSLIENSTIYLYTSNNNVRTPTNVPDLRGMSSAQVINSITAANLNVVLDGSGTVVSQDIASRKRS